MDNRLLYPQAIAIQMTDPLARRSGSGGDGLEGDYVSGTTVTDTAASTPAISRTSTL